jgi:flagellar hook-associated protein 2
MLNEVYNYFVGLDTSYQLRPQTRYDTHKKDELKVLYSKIKDAGIRSPLYLISPTESNRQFALDIKSSAISLQSSISMMQDRDSEDAVMNRQKAVVSNKDALSCEILDEGSNTLPEPFQMDIHQLASVQVNTGIDTFVTGIGPEEGTYTFQAECEDKTYEFQFNISERSRNREILGKLSRFINKSNLGITASVENGQKENNIHMTLRSKDTGVTTDSGYIFQFKDVSAPMGQEGLIEHYGLNNMTTPPANASFTINGEDKEALANSFILNNSLHITLLGEAEDSVKIGYAPDDSPIYSGVRQFTADYNNMIKTASSYPSGKGAKIIHDLKAIASTYKNQLESAGITVSSDDGKLTLDESLVRQSIEEGDMDAIFSSRHGFVARVNQTINEIKINPLEYVDKKVVTYPNTLHFPYPNPYITSMYSGLFFNNYC